MVIGRSQMKQQIEKSKQKRKYAKTRKKKRKVVL